MHCIRFTVSGQFLCIVGAAAILYKIQAQEPLVLLAFSIELTAN